MPDNNTNLPILDDIIKPGNADKAVHQPSSKVQSSLLSNDETNDSSTSRIYARTNPHTASDDRPDTIELYTDNQSDIDVTDRMQVSPAPSTDNERPVDEPIQQGGLAGTEQARPPAIDFPDFDALTEEILANVMLEMEQVLRDKIQQTLRKHFPAETRPG